MLNITSTLPVKRRWKDKKGNEFIETGAIIICGETGVVSVTNSVWQVPENWPHIRFTQSAIDNGVNVVVSMQMPRLISIE